MISQALPRVYVVDDENAQVLALCRTLSVAGYSTTGASSAAQALDALSTAAKDASSAFDVLITDLQMPNMDGIAFLRAAHRIDENLMGIVMTGHGTIDTAVAAMKNGALDYILKPFNLDVIIPVLKRAVSLRRLRLENTLLTARVAERTAALEAANHELRIINKELEAFTSSISHDVRQPLSAMISFVDVLLLESAGPLTAQQREYLGDIQQSGLSLVRLTEDLLRFSRVGHQALRREHVHVADLVTQVIRDVRNTEPGRRVDFRVGDLPDVHADPVLLRQVFVNLVANAYKFTRRTAAAFIEVSGRHEGDRCVYCVRDNGAGFDMASAEKLFTLFRRLHTSEDFEGTGVGLSLVQRIVERHGGQITAEGELNRGARFTFYLEGTAPLNHLH